jgi:hypothetical protein
MHGRLVKKWTASLAKESEKANRASIMPDQAQAAKILNIDTYPVSEDDLRLCCGARVSSSMQYAGPPAAFKSSMDSRARAKQLQKNPIIE